jgi:hypothetical protein
LQFALSKVNVVRQEFNMRLTVPYLVIARSQGETFRLLDQTEIEIPEVSEREAPTAAHYCDLTGRDPVIRTTRVYEGRFFAAAVAECRAADLLNASNIERAPEASRPPKDLITYLDMNGAHGGGTSLLADLETWYSRPNEEPEYFRSLRSVGRYEPIDDTRRQNLLSASRGLLLVDGWLHYETKEPFIGVTSTGVSQVRIDFDMRPTSRDFGGDIVQFNLADAERAEEFADREFPERGPVARRYDRLSVFEPNSLPFDAISRLAVKIGQGLVYESHRHLGQRNDADVRCWLDLREETDRALAGNCDPQRLVALITEFIDRGISIAEGRERSVAWLTQMIEGSGRQLPSPGVHLAP